MKSDELLARAQAHLVGGVGAGGRYHPLLGRALYLARGRGARFWDVDGREYLDFFTGSGANFLGHGHPAITDAVRQALEIGVICNGETEYHARLAELIAEAVPCAEKVRFANSGTEATMGAIRIARAYTGKPKILKFEGHFHGMHDYLWYNCSAGASQVRADGTIAPRPDSQGMPGALAELIGCIPPARGFLEEVRRITAAAGIVLIFDEVLSGFRMCRGGAQQFYGVTPDLCTLAKALGSGVPIAAVCGSSEVMAVLNPLGRAIMSGTYTGHLTAVMGAIACQGELAKPGFYEHIDVLARRFYGGIAEALCATGVPGVVQGIGARFGLYLGVTEPVANYRDVLRVDRNLEVRFLRGCLERGLYFHDYGHTMHHGFSAAHSAADIDQALNIIEDSLGQCASR
ncbi:MAG: aminotransferase class III-fold pyridoxal phosphate-dependent enzyme [Acidobacteria bacterium]|nr:aminotransferase class III-fold pyridoxal phosphate-dependent enzyme [Acidobacteriota bacterium]